MGLRSDLAISNNEKEFILKAIRTDHRIDGRQALEYRPIQFQFASDDTSCIVRLGQTMVMASISSSLEAPHPNRPSEGSISFDVFHTAMAGSGPDFARKNEDAVELSRLVERGLRESRAVDVEALCVQPGRKVWHLQVDIRILDNCGNVTDAVGIAALGALCAFRRPDVSIDPNAPGGIIIHPVTEKEPVKLTMHHLPLPITFAFFENGELMAIDPVSKEEATSTGSFTAIINQQGEVCCVQKTHGIGISKNQVMQCMRLATSQVHTLVEDLKAALEAHDVARVAARVRRHTAAVRQQGSDGSHQQMDDDKNYVPESMDDGPEGQEEQQERPKVVQKQSQKRQRKAPLMQGDGKDDDDDDRTMTDAYAQVATMIVEKAGDDGVEGGLQDALKSSRKK